jgi:hypothetical protein
MKKYTVAKNDSTTHPCKWFVIYDDTDRRFIMEMCDSKRQAQAMADDYNAQDLDAKTVIG